MKFGFSEFVCRLVQYLSLHSYLPSECPSGLKCVYSLISLFMVFYLLVIVFNLLLWSIFKSRKLQCWSSLIEWMVFTGQRNSQTDGHHLFLCSGFRFCQLGWMRLWIKSSPADPDDEVQFTLENGQMLFQVHTDLTIYKTKFRTMRIYREWWFWSHSGLSNKTTDSLIVLVHFVKQNMSLKPGIRRHECSETGVPGRLSEDLKDLKVFYKGCRWFCKVLFRHVLISSSSVWFCSLSLVSLRLWCNG